MLSQFDHLVVVIGTGPVGSGRRQIVTPGVALVIAPPGLPSLSSERGLQLIYIRPNAQAYG